MTDVTIAHAPTADARIGPHKVNIRTTRIVAAGYVSIAAFLGGFGYWAAAAPIGGAIIADGVVAAAGQNIMIQHLEGGIIRDISYIEGDRVRAGDPVLVLDATMAETQLNRISNQLMAMKTKAARLEAERDGTNEMRTPSDLEANPQGAEFSEMLGQQKKEFDARIARFKAEKNILGQRVVTLNEAIVGLSVQKKAVEDQFAIVKEEVGRKRGLLDKGLASRSEYTALLRSEADLIGQAGSMQSQIASSKSQIVEAGEQIERLTTARVEQALSQLNEVRASIADLEEQAGAAESVLKRTVIRSPVDGVIVRTVFNSPGSVVGAGEIVVEVLPTLDEPIIQARISTTDIDALEVGQSAELRLSALNTRNTPLVKGAVIYISADRLLEPQTGQPYYNMRLKITGKLPPEIKADQIYPGMPVEAFISTEERTFIEYLTKPILDSFNRAFREE